MYLARSLEDCLLEASAQFPVLLLTGPRQVGKTTLLLHLSGQERRSVSLDDPAIRALAVEDPALFLQRFGPPVLIDEIQYAPGLLPYIKLHVDSDRRPGAYWLTGSQPFHLMRGITETLAGRVAVVNLLGFSRRETDGRDLRREPFLPGRPARDDEAIDFDGLYRRIWLGGFPDLVTGRVTDRDLFFSSYVQTYLQRDVRDLVQVGDQLAFARFVRACAARTGQLLNTSDLARDVEVSVPTARSWLSILEATYQILLLRPFHSNVTTRLVKTPKMYFLDTGLCAYLCEWTSPETLAAGAMSGPIFETWVVTEIVKSWWHRMRSPSWFFYRDRDGREIDLLFVQDRTLYPVEIKRSASPRPRWIRTFGALERFEEARGPGAVVSMVARAIPLSAVDEAVPVNAL